VNAKYESVWTCVVGVTVNYVSRSEPQKFTLSKSAHVTTRGLTGSGGGGTLQSAVGGASASAAADGGSDAELSSQDGYDKHKRDAMRTVSRVVSVLRLPPALLKQVCAAPPLARLLQAADHLRWGCRSHRC
jgi:hypothetical protein